MISEKELTALKSSLPRGYFKKTLLKTSLSEKTVSNFFSGKSYNLEVHEAALEVLKEDQLRKNAVIKQQNEFIHE
jgi:hypothetical protein